MRKKGTDTIKIKGTKRHSKSFIKYDNLPHSTSSSRNNIYKWGQNVSSGKMMVKDKTDHGINAIHLEHSQEVQNWLSTLDYTNLRRNKLINDSQNKPLKKKTSKQDSKSRNGDNKGSLNPKKLLNGRIQDVSNIDTKNSLNISNFLNCSMHPKMRKTEMKKKFEKKVGRNAYKTISGKSNSRSQNRYSHFLI